MAFGKFFSFGFSEPRYIRRSRAYLEEALEETFPASDPIAPGEVKRDNA